MNNLKETAYDLYNEGLNPLPLFNNKAPQLPEGHTFLYEPMHDIENFFRSPEKIGVACGEVSNGFYCIDFDAHNGEDIKSIFDEFIDISFVKQMINEGKLSCYQTAGGGYHIYFRCSKELKLPKQKFSKWSSGKTMIELIANGGYVVIAPSHGYSHVTGVEYVKIEDIEVEEVADLFSTAKAYNQQTETTNTTKSNRTWGNWSNSDIVGQYNNDSEDEAKDLLYQAGWTFISKSNTGIERWLRPGKDPHDRNSGTSATWGRLKNMFYVFSSNADKFEEGKAYSPFNILTILKFNGDWKAAKNSLKPVEEKHEYKEVDFPINALPEAMEYFIQEHYRVYKYNPSFMACAFFFTMSTIVGNKIKLRINNSWVESPIFWFIGVGNAGTMKTHPMKTMIKPLIKIDLKNKEGYDERLKEYNKAVLASKKDNKVDIPDVPIFEQHIVNDATVEALIQVHSYNENGLGLYKDEIKGFYDALNQYRGGKGGDESFWLESFSNGSHLVNRKSNQSVISIENIHIPIIGGIQPEPLKDIALKSKDSGFSDRFLYTNPITEINDFTTESLPDEYSHKYKELIEFIVNDIKNTDNIILDLDNETRNLLTQYQNEYQEIKRSEDIEQMMVNYYSKLITYLGRFTLILAISDHYINNEDLVVNISHVNRAKELCDYFANAARNMFNSAIDSNEMDHIIKRSGAISKTDKAISLIEAGVTDRKMIIEKSGVSKSYLSKLFKKFPN